MKKNWSLIVGLSLPVIVMLALAAYVYWPQLTFKTPTQDFIYAMHSFGGNYTGAYEIKSGKIVYVCTKYDDVTFKQTTEECAPDSGDKLYLYSFVKDAPQEITLTQANALTYNNNPMSRDGYTINQDYGSYSGGGFSPLISPPRYNEANIVVSKGRSKNILNIYTPRDFYSSEVFNFLGWVQ